MMRTPSASISTASAAPAKSISVYSPTVIALCSLLLNFAAGLVLASINWLRLGQTTKAVTHLVIALLGAIAFVWLLVAGGLGQAPFLVNLGVALYLRWRMKTDIEDTYVADFTVETAPWWQGVLIALAVTFAIMATLMVAVNAAAV